MRGVSGARIAARPARRSRVAVGAEVLVGAVPSQRDLHLIEREGWYRVSIGARPDRWPPRWLALYEPASGGGPGHVSRFARITGIDRATREELFPGEKPRPAASARYYRLRLEDLQPLEKPVPCKRPRSIAFFTTTMHKLTTAATFNDLFDESPLEDRLWAEFKKAGLRAERQWLTEVAGRRYRLDFALFCKQGKLDIETDGDTFHALKDNIRQNQLTTQGWGVLRYNSRQLDAELPGTVAEIIGAVEHLGGVARSTAAPHSPWPSSRKLQLSFSEALEPYESIDE